ncbi:hypothetical protein VNO78_19294 [Psophocarpus tetragonolobus]|uniref:Gnk2-homologous domain-containing protein n=1 Tax=Psophocarpus tetragonolobus TaxID=3891 RepID=A0AAN9S828_PSOTE
MSSFEGLKFLCFATTQAQVPTFLHQNCSTNRTTADSVFQINLKTLVSSLSSNATAKNEFHNATVAGTKPSDTVYGLYMCRGDVPFELCAQCVVNATQKLSSDSECSLSKQAVIWYDECMVRYSNRSFFSTVDTTPRVGLLNTANISNQESFMRLLFDTMNETADEAVSAPNGAEKYATNEANISGFQTLYCLVQCTQDLSPQGCRTCLSVAIGQLSWCCLGKQGGRILNPSCNVRYELYPFYRSDTAVSAPSPEPSGFLPPTDSSNSGGSSVISSRTIVAIVVPITVAVLIFIVGIWLLSKRAAKKRNSTQDPKTETEISAVESLRFDFSTIEAATEKFSDANKLGEGGFGEVYKIISGKKNGSFYETDAGEDLLGYAWKLWKDETPLELLDHSLRESYAPNEVIKCIHIGLLCVQEDPIDRPTMASVVLMLDSYSVTLPAPNQPAFYIHGRTEPNMLKGLKIDQSTINSTSKSINEMSTSEVDPR